MLKMQVETITPEKAREYLKANTNNYRKLSRARVYKYAEDMKSGRWQLNGEAIAFDENGVLKDGQHRLAAIVFAKVPVKTAVVRGVDESVDIYDVGSGRTINQIANASGVDCNQTVVCAAGLIVNEFKPIRSKSEIVTYIRDHERDLLRAYRGTCYGTRPKSKNGPCVAASYLMLRTDSISFYELELFYRIFNDDASVIVYDGYEPTPAWTACRMMDQRKGRTGYQFQKERLEIMVHALMDFHNGNKVGVNYKISEPFSFTDILAQVRKEDGLEENA